MYMPKFEFLSFASLPTQRKQVVLRAMLECLICADWNYILEHPDLPSLYDFAPKYVLKVRPAGIDAWQDIPQTIALGSGDCKDFACWRVAELRQQGYDDVFPHIKVSYHEDPSGREPMMTVYHIQVRIHDIIEDPSAILGMPTQVTYEELRGGQPSQQQQQMSQQMAAGMFSQERLRPYMHAPPPPFNPAEYGGMPFGGLVDAYGHPLHHHHGPHMQGMGW